MERIQAAIQKAKEQRGDAGDVAGPAGPRSPAGPGAGMAGARAGQPAPGPAWAELEPFEPDPRLLPATASSPSPTPTRRTPPRHDAHQDPAQRARTAGPRSASPRRPPAAARPPSASTSPSASPTSRTCARCWSTSTSGGRRWQADRAHEGAVHGERAAGHPAGGGELRALRREPRHRHQRHRGAELLRAPAERGHRRGSGEPEGRVRAGRDPLRPAADADERRRHGLPAACRLRAAVAAAEKSRLDEVDKCEQDLAEQTNVLGVVLNKCRYMGADYGYY